MRGYRVAMQVVEALSADEWELVTSDAFVPLTCAAFERDFRGRIEFERFGPADGGLTVSHVTTDGLAVDRTARQAAHANSDDIHLTFTFGGAGVIRQDGRQARVRAGSVSTYATDRAYQLDYTAPGQRQILVQVSKRALGLPVEVVERSCELLLVDAPEAADALRTTIEETRGSADGDAPEEAETMRDLVATAIRASVGGRRALPTTRGGMLATVRGFMRARLHDPGLDVTQIADAHFVSRRSLYELFAPFEQTPGEHLRRLRLARARELMATDLTIAEIAGRCGFTDPTTFTRAFHREFGMLPSDLRR